jgi:HNH endonuclease
MLDFLLNLLPVAWRPRQILEMRQRAGQWRAIRAAHLAKEPACAACGRTGDVIVHHVIPVSFDASKELSETNLLTLCNYPCHIVFGHFMSYHCYNKDVRKMTAEYRKALDKRKCLKP